MSAKVISREDIGQLIDALGAAGYEVIGPSKVDDAIVYQPIAGVDDLPIGWTDQQDGGSYRLVRRDDEALFGYAVGPQSWITTTTL